jgi:hypothetical protein
MPVPVSDIRTLRAYVCGVIGKAKHHAPNVDEIILALAGAVITWKNSTALQVRSAPGGGLTDMLWSHWRHAVEDGVSVSHVERS